MENRIRNFHDLEAWKRAHGLTVEIYKITKDFPREELYGITSQLRRAVSSIAANIAEGFARYHFKDKTRFYFQARGSAAEVQSFLLLVRDLEFIDSALCENMFEKTSEVLQLINGLIRSIKKQSK